MSNKLDGIFEVSKRPPSATTNGQSNRELPWLSERGEAASLRAQCQHAIYDHGYREEGTTTTPFDMLVRNRVSRYHLVTQVIRAAAPRNPRVAIRASERVLFYEYFLRDFAQEIRKTGQDPEVIRDWKWRR